jgi:hypothetical protein
LAVGNRQFLILLDSCFRRNEVSACAGMHWQECFLSRRAFLRIRKDISGIHF